MLHTPLCRVMQLHRLIGPLCEASLNLTAPDGESLEPHPDCPFLAVERCFVSPRPLRPRHNPDGEQVRLHQVAQGGALPVLPDGRAQRGHAVSFLCPLVRPRCCGGR